MKKKSASQLATAVVSPRAFVGQSQFLIGLKREQVDSLPWGIVKANRQGVYTYANRAMCEIVGVNSIEGRKSVIYSKVMTRRCREHLETRLRAARLSEYRVELTRPSDGVKVPVLVSALPRLTNMERRGRDRHGP